MEEIRIEKYSPELRDEWDNFVAGSKNGTFLFYRDYMEYHSDRFKDSSLLFYWKNRLAALLPANEMNGVLYTHQGLTYGGLITTFAITAKAVLDMFEVLKEYLLEQGITSVIYKAVPHIYHKLPSEEDLYALFRNGAELIGRAISTCIVQKDKIRYSELRRRGMQKAADHNLVVRRNNRFRVFWKILNDNLIRKHGVFPVHSVSEIEYLKTRFPNNIHLHEVYDNEKCLGGCVIFDTDRVTHVQYISATEEGKAMGALDCLFDYLIQKVYAHKPYFEFGTSTENGGIILNEGLISQKEGFGGRGIVYDTYSWQLNK
jgi:hypothetical protein